MDRTTSRHGRGKALIAAVLAAALSVGGTVAAVAADDEPTAAQAAVLDYGRRPWPGLSGAVHFIL
jgi:uncharacterized membrane protein